MNLVCPICQAEFPLAAALNDVAARQAVVKAFSLTQMGDRLIAYVTLFKPAKQALSMTRLAKLLDELVDNVKRGQVNKNGNTYAAPQAYWINAIDQMLANRAALSLPLKNHNYLTAIIVGMGEKVEAKKEAEAEKGRHLGEFHEAKSAKAPHPQGACPTSLDAKAPSRSPKPTKSEMPASAQAQIKKFADKARMP